MAPKPPKPIEDKPGDALRDYRGTSRKARGTNSRGLAPHKRKQPSDMPLVHAKPQAISHRLHLLDEDDRLTDPGLRKDRLTPPSIIDRYRRYLAKPPKEPRILRTGDERRASILRGSPGADSPVLITLRPAPPKTSGEKPWIEIAKVSQVRKYDPVIVRVAQALEVDPDLIRAIMYMETTHGWYDQSFDRVRLNKTILPMNVHVDYWKGLGITRQSLHDSTRNIIVGAYILKGIQERLGDAPTIEEIATLYQNLRADQVSAYGLRVAAIYRSKLWEQR